MNGWKLNAMPDAGCGVWIENHICFLDKVKKCFSKIILQN